MKPVHQDLYKKITQVSTDVQESLRKKGVVVPVRNKDGSICVGKYKILKNSTGYYSIVDQYGDVTVEMINLPQTAAVVANGLALGKQKNDQLIESDKKYGYALFDEEVHNRAVELSVKKPLERFEIMLNKRDMARARKELYKNEVIKSFEKLIKLV